MKNEEALPKNPDVSPDSPAARSVDDAKAAARALREGGGQAGASPMVPSPRKRGRPAGSKNAPREQTPEVSAPLHIWTPEQVGAVLDIPFKLGQAQYPDHEQWERALEQAKLSYPTFAECLTVLVQFNPVYILLGIAIVQYGSALGSAVAESRSREKKKALEDGATPKD